MKSTGTCKYMGKFLKYQLFKTIAIMMSSGVCEICKVKYDKNGIKHWKGTNRIDSYEVFALFRKIP